jgi:uncharacterized repeat protein (TIGR03803 family)
MLFRVKGRSRAVGRKVDSFAPSHTVVAATALGIVAAGSCLLLSACGMKSALPGIPTGVTGATVPVRLPNTVDYREIYSFRSGKDGAGPGGTLLNIDGVIYGTTANGGAGYHGAGDGSGVVYTLTTRGRERVVHRFKFGNVNGPSAGLTNFRHVLYGTTEDGGTHRCGTVFSMSHSGSIHYLYNFRCAPDGANPSSKLIAVGGKLYGTTGSGGPQNYGTIFEISPTGHYRQLHVFLYGRGGQHVAGDLIYVNGEFYGVTYSGGGTDCQDVGNLGCGIVFKMNTSGYTQAVYRFQGGSDGDSPSAGLTQWNGMLYGTTHFGGNQAACAGGCGTIFEVNPRTKKEHVLYRFVGGADGMLPSTGMTLFHDVLYGGTALGGNGGCFPYGSCGTVFALNALGQESVVHAFEGDGYLPSSPLLPIDGVLYGTTFSGGAACGTFGCGMVYSIQP